MAAYTLSENVETVRFGLSVIAGIVASLGVIFGAAWKCGAGRIIKRHRDKKNAEFLANVAGVVKPMIDGSRAAAKSQHDEQNNAIEQLGISLHARIDHLDERVDQGFDQIDQRLAKCADRLAAHDVRLAVIEARNPSTRSREGDHQ